MSERGQMRRELLTMHSRLRDMAENVGDIIDDLNALTSGESAEWKERAEKAEAALVLAEACIAEIRGIDAHDDIANILDRCGYWDDDAE